MRALRIRCLPAVASALLLTGLSSCATSNWFEHRFGPAPLETEVTTQSVAGAEVRALVTVIGIERGKSGAKSRVIVRIRLENMGSVPTKLAADSLSMVSADLKAFLPGIVQAPEVPEIAPGADSTVDCAFEFPDGSGPDDFDLSGVNLRLSLVFGEQRVTTGMTFQRIDWNYPDPRYPQMHVGVGMGWSSFH
jgi:hypothetical protein